MHPGVIKGGLGGEERVGEDGDGVDGRTLVALPRVLLVHLPVDVHSEESRPVQTEVDLPLPHLTAGSGLRPHLGLRYGVPVEFGDLHLNSDIFRHLEVEVGVAPALQVIEHPRGVAELLPGALSEESEGVPPGLLPLLPHLEPVVG